MSHSMKVIAYSGYRGEQEPRAVVIDGERLAVREVKRRWRSPDGRYFDVDVAGGRRLVVRCAPSSREDGEDAGWSVVRRRDPD